MDKQNKNFSKGNSVRSSFGPDIPRNISVPVALNISDYVILTNTEFKFDEFLVGFEFFMANDGIVEFWVNNYLFSRNLTKNTNM